MLNIAAFELKYMLRSPQMYVAFAVFFLLNFAAMASDNVQIGAGGNVLSNSPYAIMQSQLIMAVFFMFVVPAFIANSVLKDADHKFEGILYATPISRFDYLGGRFLGSFVAAGLAFAGSPIGMLAGSFWPTLDPETLAPTNIGHYLYVFGVLTVPTLFILSAPVFALAVITRSVMYTYLAAIGMLMLYFVTRQFFSGPEYDDLLSVIDPFLFSAFQEETRYWTASERNSLLIGFEGAILVNRLVWLGLAAALCALSFLLFSFRQPARQKKQKQRDEAVPATVAALARLRVTPHHGFKASLQQLRQRTAFEVGAVFKSLPFLIIVGFSIFLMVSAFLNRNVGYGLEALPVTRLMVTSIQNSLGLGLIVVVIFYSADIIWRERTARVNEIMDALPVASWVFAASKLLALSLVLASVLVIGIALAIVVQMLSGYGALEINLYIGRGFAFFITPMIMIAVLSAFVQVVAKNRFVGMMVMVVYMIGTIILSQFGFEHPLYQFASGVPSPLSDMNGSGRFLAGNYWLFGYWGCLSVLFVMLSYMLWNRGTLQPLRYRLRRLADFKRPVAATVAALSLTGFAASGGVIYYNTNILNQYLTADDIEDLAAEYEARYRQYEDLPQPRTTAVSMDVDIYPADRRVVARGTHILENKTAEAIDAVHMVFPPEAEVVSVSLDGAELESADDTFGYHIFRMDSPFLPGESRTLTFETEIAEQGFVHARPNVTLVRNGTFISNSNIAPYIGFWPGGMIQDRNTRRRRGLEPLPRAPKLEDESQYRSNYIRQDSDFVTFETTVSTALGQTAVAPGYLIEDWVEGDRHYFRYEMDSPILNFYSYLSADYTVVRDRVADVDIEVFHHAPHPFNVARMIESVKDSLTYFSEAFSPYQHRQLRILEFPAYRSFAQAFPNTVPYSEGIGFIADIASQGDIDLPYYVTAHEVAHQWWAHQVMSANTQGGTLLVETLAQYGALLVMEQQYGPHQIRKFLKYELDRYLASRASDPEGEVPLYRVENQQYIHYRKGSVIMYALKDYLGEDVVNRALRRLIDARGFSAEPYATTLDFLAFLKAEAPVDQHGLIEDFFEKITLFDLKAEDAVAVADETGVTVRFELSAGKVYADSEGVEQAADMDLPVDIGIFRKSPADDDFKASDVLYLAKHRLTGGSVTLTLPVDGEALFVGVDPYNKLVDRNSDDNLIAVRSDEAAAAPAP